MNNNHNEFKYTFSSNTTILSIVWTKNTVIYLPINELLWEKIKKFAHISFLSSLCLYLWLSHEAIIHIQEKFKTDHSITSQTPLFLHYFKHRSLKNLFIYLYWYYVNEQNEVFLIFIKTRGESNFISFYN